MVPLPKPDRVSVLEKGGARDLVMERSETPDLRIREVHFKTAAGAELCRIDVGV